MSNFNTDGNGIQTLATPPTGDAGQAIDSNFGVISSLIAAANAAIAAINSLTPGFAVKADNLSDLPNVATARSNLGLGSAATQASSAFDAAGAAAAAQASAQTYASNAGNLSSGTVNSARLGSGTANSSVFLRGDGTWAAPAAGNSFSSILLNGSTSGTITITAPAIAGTYALAMPSGQGTAGSTLVNDGAGNLAWGYPLVFAGSLLAQTFTTSSAPQSIIFNVTDAGTYRVSVLVVIASVTSNTLTINLTWTDQSLASQASANLTSANGASTLNSAKPYPFPDFVVLAGAATTISVNVTTPAHSATMTYSIWTWITRIQ